MEHNRLLQKMEILSRKINKLKDDSTIVKATTASASIYSKPANYTAWQGHSRLHNQPKGNTSDLNGYSKYRYTKKNTSVTTSNIPRVNYYNTAPLPVPFTPKLTLPAPPNVYVNPHFKARENTKPSLEVLVKPKELHSKEHAPLSVNISKKTVYVNPTLFNSNKPFQPVLPSDVKKPNNTQLPSATTDSTKANQDKQHFIHVNRSVISTKPVAAVPQPDNSKASVHVNPTVFARLKSELNTEKPNSRVINTPTLNRFRKTLENSGNKSLISISRTKLVRGKKFSQNKTPSQYSTVPKMRLLSSSKVTSSPLVRIAKNVCSKYKYIRKSSANSIPTNLNHSLRKIAPLVKTKYKLDRRMHKTPKPYKNVQKYTFKYERSRNKILESNLQGVMQRKRYSLYNKSSFGNRVWGNIGSLQPKRVLITDRKLLRIGTSPIVKRLFSSVQSSTLLRIGGILYKTSRTQLTRTSSESKPNLISSRPRVYNKTPVGRKTRSKVGHIVHVRGDKFLMDPQGRTLKRVESDNRSYSGKMKRVDIGGATFIQSSPNVLIRTNTHYVRSLLSQAKQKSIALLAKQLRKNNTICKFYRRFGKCYQHEKNRCPCVHDKKYVAICKGFLKGNCGKKVCLLSHDLIPEKMPTCKYFLQVCCARDKCPFLHIKLNAKAPLCIGFLQGYCSDGLACRKWHFNICPQFDKSGSCPKGKYCPFPHTPRYKELTLDHMKLDYTRIIGMYEDYYNKLEEKPKEEVIVRYFNVIPQNLEVNSADEEEDKSVNINEEQLSCATKDLSAIGSNLKDCNSGSKEWCSDKEEPRFTKRSKIGYLPSYIPLCIELME